MSPSDKVVQTGTIRAALDVLLEPGTVAELRILRTRQKTVSGYFNDFDKLADAAAAERMKEYWTGALAQLRSVLEKR